jgi:hypothetical protein
LHIGEGNVQQFFPRDVQMIELELDHLRIVCPLDESFWDDQPEIHDHRLSSWLESKRNSGKMASNAASMTMVPCGAYAYRVMIVNDAETEHGFVAPPAAAYFTPVVSPAKLLDRRKRNITPKLERRRVGRLKVDDRLSA